MKRIALLSLICLLALTQSAWMPLTVVGGGAPAATRGTITENTLDGGIDTTSRSSGDPYTACSGDCTITANRLALLAVMGRNDTAAEPSDPTIGGTLSATWVKVNSETCFSSNLRIKIWVYRTLVGTNQTGTVTIDPATSEGWIRASWSLAEFISVDTTGTNGSGAVQQSVTRNRTDDGGPGTSLTITLAAFEDASNRPYAAFCGNVNDELTVDGDFSEIFDTENGTIDTTVEWRSSSADTTASVSWTSSSEDIGGIGVEIKSSE